MPIYMDRHYAEGAAQEDVASAHIKDLQIQDKYRVRFLTYWFDEARYTGFCLVDAPNKAAISKAHAEAHGLIPHEIIEVDATVVEAFLGRMRDPAPPEGAGAAPGAAIDSAFRTIMFTDLKDSAAINARLGDNHAMRLLRIHNALIRNALRDHGGREVKHTGDGIMASFTSVADAVTCSVAIQKAFAAYNHENAETAMYLRIGLSAGEPVQEDNDLFGATVQLAARICANAKPSQILASRIVLDQCQEERTLFSDAGMITPKGFDRSEQVYEIQWH